MMYNEEIKSDIKWIVVILFFLFCFFLYVYYQEDPSDKKRYIPIKISAYTADPAETNNLGGITSSGKKVAKGMCALSRDLETDFGFKFGDKVSVKIGEDTLFFIFEDRMNKRWNRKIDVFIGSKVEATKWGVKKGFLLLEEKQ